jgi:hypothetical protein
MLIATLALLAAQPWPADDGWARFSAHQQLARIEVDVAIGTMPGPTSKGDLVYWVRRTTKRPDQWPEIARTDSIRCPAILAMVRSMRDIPAPRPVPPMLDGADIVVTADGVSYELQAPAAYPGRGTGVMTISSNVGTPLAAWVEHSLAALGQCLPPVL